jgi:MEDS: MEthanogen/methylotroph, DcmR Sensory domain
MLPIPGNGNGHEHHPGSCRLVVRKNKGLDEILQFVIAGLEVGQQVVAMASPACLKEVARGVGETGMKPDALLRNSRLVLLAAPDCLAFLSKPQDSFQRSPLRRSGSILRWVSDWSWAYGNGHHESCILEYQNRLHEYVRSLTTLSLCTVHCENLERASLLAILAEHRRAARGVALV